MHSQTVQGKRIYAEIDVDAIFHNMQIIRKALPENSKLMLVLKADAYGHGSEFLAKLLENSCDYFAVADLDEALELRQAGVTLPILVLSYIAESSYEAAILQHITFTVYREEDMRRISDVAVRLQQCATVHYAVDTGMHRIGFAVTEENIETAYELSKLPNIRVEGIFSHFYDADGISSTPSEKQISLFRTFTDGLAEKGLTVPLRHICNSAALLRFPDCYDMVRAGLVLYGLYPSETVRKEAEKWPALEKALSLHSVISHMQTVEKGEGIGYSHSFIAPRTMQIATVPVGYADGYPRILSGKSSVLIDGIRCPTVGRICMDQMTVDITNLQNPKIGMPVTLIGEEKGNRITADELASLADTVSYEIICGLSRRVPRIYKKAGDVIGTSNRLIH